MERSLQIQTGESIEIRYELAGLGSRFLAVALDGAIQVGVAGAVVVMFALGAGPLEAALAHVPVSPGAGKIVRAVGGAVAVCAIFLLFFGYFIIFELWWSGRTPGKRALGLRVVRDAGFPLDVGSAVIRNLVRVIEFGLAFYTVSAISTLVSAQNKRLGDFAAGTIVVRDRSCEATAIDAFLAREPGTDDELSGSELELIERYLARRAQLEPGARKRLAAAIGERVRPQLRASFAHLDDDALIEHLGR